MTYRLCMTSFRKMAASSESTTACNVKKTRKRKLSDKEETDIPVVTISNEENDDEKNEGEETSDEKDDTPVDGNPSWADAMQKVLRTSKPHNKLLTKAKKDNAISNKKTKTENEFEIVKNTEEGEEIISVEESKDVEKTETKKPKVKREREIMAYIKPNITDRERERALARIATKGVVQLFNAVRQQQTTLETKLKEVGSVTKREKVMKSMTKGDFLDMLKGRTKSIDVKDAIKTKDEGKEEKPTWDVFRDDFMLGARMKDWDKQTEENKIT